MGDEEPKIIKKSKFLSLSDKNVSGDMKSNYEIHSSPREVTKILVKSKASSGNLNIQDNDIEVIIERCVTPGVNKRKRTEVRVETEPSVLNSYRKDAYGSPIVKRGPKNYRVSFQDQLNKNKLQEIVYIQRFKNVDLEENEQNVKQNQCCGRCQIF
jgi:hypothetical protein